MYGITIESAIIYISTCTLQCTEMVSTPMYLHAAMIAIQLSQMSLEEYHYTTPVQIAVLSV